MRCASATLPSPRAASPATYSKCGVSPRITQPSATLASNRFLAAPASATTGISKAPGTHVTSTCESVMPARRSASRALSSSLLVMCSWNRLTTTATCRWRSEVRAAAGDLCGTSVRQEVAELVPLDVEIGTILVGWRRHDRQPLDDLEPIAFEPHQLHRIVGRSEEHTSELQSHSFI